MPLAPTQRAAEALPILLSLWIPRATAFLWIPHLGGCPQDLRDYASDDRHRGMDTTGGHNPGASLCPLSCKKKFPFNG
ncbi:UNVERIFIED_CONTAM: hypothetical protein Sradi_2624800 [Sesamum radiatum]|uniref:Secreted protein n=1 Tax=Sesamum radiatum TaxID=300843 RepID=A0AAW2S4E6_SESRA